MFGWRIGKTQEIDEEERHKGNYPWTSTSFSNSYGTRLAWACFVCCHPL